MKKIVTCKVQYVGDVALEVEFPAYRRSVYESDGPDSACYWKIEADGTYTTIDKEVSLKHWMGELDVRYTIHRSVQCRGHIERISQDPKFICGEGACHSTAGEFWTVFEEAKAVIESQFPRSSDED